MEAILNLLNLFFATLDAALVGFLAYGAYLVLGGGGFRRDAPEDAAQPHLGANGELRLHH